MLISCNNIFKTCASVNKFLKYHKYLCSVHNFIFFVNDDVIVDVLKEALSTFQHSLAREVGFRSCGILCVNSHQGEQSYEVSYSSV